MAIQHHNCYLSLVPVICTAIHGLSKPRVLLSEKECGSAVWRNFSNYTLVFSAGIPARSSGRSRVYVGPISLCRRIYHRSATVSSTGFSGQRLLSFLSAPHVAFDFSLGAATANIWPASASFFRLLPLFLFSYLLLFVRNHGKLLSSNWRWTPTGPQHVSCLRNLKCLNWPKWADPRA